MSECIECIGTVNIAVQCDVPHDRIESNKYIKLANFRAVLLGTVVNMR